MRQKTTTQKLHEAISNNLLTIVKAQCSYKSSNRIDEINKEEFKDNLDFLSESGVFSGFVDWHYGMNPYERDGFIIESGAKNPYSENIVTVYLRVGEDVDVEDIEGSLLYEED